MARRTARRSRFPQSAATRRRRRARCSSWPRCPRGSSACTSTTGPRRRRRRHLGLRARRRQRLAPPRLRRPATSWLVRARHRAPSRARGWSASPAAADKDEGISGGGKVIGRTVTVYSLTLRPGRREPRLRRRREARARRRRRPRRRARGQLHLARPRRRRRAAAGAGLPPRDQRPADHRRDRRRHAGHRPAVQRRRHPPGRRRRRPRRSPPTRRRCPRASTPSPRSRRAPSPADFERALQEGVRPRAGPSAADGYRAMQGVLAGDREARARPATTAPASSTPTVRLNAVPALLALELRLERDLRDGGERLGERAARLRALSRPPRSRRRPDRAPCRSPRAAILVIPKPPSTCVDGHLRLGGQRLRRRCRPA